MVGNPEQPDTDDDHDTAINCPMDIASHIAAGQYIDALQEGDYPREYEQYA